MFHFSSYVRNGPGVNKILLLKLVVDYSYEHPKGFISRINEINFFHKIARKHLPFYDVYFGMSQPFVSLRSNLLA